MRDNENKVRTSITMTPELLNTVRRICERDARSVSGYIEDALTAYTANETVTSAAVAVPDDQLILTVEGTPL